MDEVIYLSIKPIHDCEDEIQVLQFAHCPHLPKTFITISLKYKHEQSRKDPMVIMYY